MIVKMIWFESQVMRVDVGDNSRSVPVGPSSPSWPNRVISPDGRSLSQNTVAISLE